MPPHLHIEALHVAQVAPLWESLPPQQYGGIESVVSVLTEGLVQRGHHVTLFAVGGSQTNADLNASCPNPLRSGGGDEDYPYFEAHQLSQVFDQQNRFDIIHFHDKCASLPLSQCFNTPTVHTLHYPFTDSNHALFEHFPQLPVINISEAQKQAMPHLNYIDTIHNSIDLSQYPFAAKCQTPPYITFVGRMAPEKGPQFAIAIAQHAGLPLKMAGKIDLTDQEFFDSQLKPHIDGQRIQYLGEVNHAQKVDLLSKAAVTVFPIIWPEPFGLVMLESMACGTPVIGMNCGAVPEVIADGTSGFICSTIKEFVHKIPATLQLHRTQCRQHVEDLFHPMHMVAQYEQAYQQVIGKKSASHNNLTTFHRQRF